MVKFPPVNAEVKPLAHLLKLAEEHDERNIVVAYWARMGACRMALRLVPGKKSPETTALIKALLDWLEQIKQSNQDNEGITSETTAQALIEEYALRLFEHGDQQDHAGVFNKNTVKTFYTAGMLMDVLDQFGHLDDEFREKRRYAKWKAAYIHNCLKSGEMPVPGPPTGLDENTSGIINKSDLTEDELKSYTKYTGPMNFEDINKPLNPLPPQIPPENLIPFNPPRPTDDVNFSHAPASSPITPLFPSNPTPFNTPNPVTPEVPPVAPSVAPRLLPQVSSGGFTPNPELIQKAQKFCKFATSALNYDDVKSAVTNLHKALNLLQTGEE